MLTEDQLKDNDFPFKEEVLNAERTYLVLKYVLR